MADYEIRRRANIGSSSLILIFIVLCLAAFGILSLENAQREDTFSRKNAAAVQAYYQADRAAEAFVQSVDQAMLSPEIPMEEIPVSKDFAMGSGLVLHVELAMDPEKKISRIQTWKMMDQGEFEIDQSIPVWDGE